MPVTTRQPSLTVNYTITLTGNFPIRDGGSGDQGIGHIRLFAFDFNPSGTADTGGALQSISANTALFSVLGTQYGGNGTTTFGLPNLDGRAGVSQGQGPGLSVYDVGQSSGEASTSLLQSMLPVARGGDGGQLPTAEAATTISYCINAFGLFPSSGGGSSALGLIGQITAFAGNFEPNGSLLCDGRLLAISEYDTLYQVIGTTYGGDGQSTFALPDLRGRVPIGQGTGPGLAGVTLGETRGSEGLGLTTANLPTAMGGSATPISNYGPSLGITYLIALSGLFPSRGGNNGPDGDLGSPAQIGEIVMFAGNYAPSGYAIAAGQLLPIQNNAALYSLIGTNFGGNGSTTFALPDLRGRVAIDEGSSGFIGRTEGFASTTLTMADIPALNLVGTNGADTYYGSNLADTINGGAGVDQLIGNGGDDIYVVDDLGDVVTEQAGAGTDTVRTSVLGYALPTNVENIVYIGAGAASLLGNAADNVIALGDVGGVLNFAQGGNDSGTGGTGQDGFYFGGSFDANDSVNGGAGTLDQVALQGDYSAGVALGANSAVGIEQYVLLPGNVTRFGVTGNPTESYNITTGNAAIAAGQRLTFQANTLRAGENFTLDASAELDGSVFTYGGLGTENLRGSQNGDSFFFGTGRFNASDVVDGQGGSDQIGLQGTYSGANAVTFGATQLANVEFIVCLSNNDTRSGGAGSGTPYSYTLTMNNGNVAAGATLIIQANNLASDEVLNFNGAAELDGHFTIYSGNGNDRIVGGALNDIISGRGGRDALFGRAGDDVFLYTNVSDSGVGAARDVIGDFTTGDKIDLSAIDAITGGANNAFSFIGDGAFSNIAGQLRAENAGGNDWLVEADINGDGVADMQIYLTTTDAHVLVAGDFVL